ncbi:DUF2637 domain-containing protein [Microbispora bryophytorum]|uniref:DUF2637 domain-containing protein n=1 Tax=Microbispora bryophytorum TaxID=1460882 RepID=A0A8H9GX86_9ACTN|nr:DUF2637 domain-containing protein [Microbispora bryophytorum]MBD3135747.1 DUF2637 domain-containing protein [Microbispora bryophytorum]TQS09909.1 DUF2637 domain-containing protein [Microbispora bryophytorum]GGN99265.1 hypothetical protein GCM10011574_04730 [Microbispora bryophytorum]
MAEPDAHAVRRIQRTTIAGVVLLALIAAVVSFRHMHELCLRHGEDHLAAVLIPLAVDGLIVVASMSILLANRYGLRGGMLAWSLLVVGSLASLGANVAVAEPSLIGRIIAAWPSLALIGSYEILMSQIRRFAGGLAESQELPALSADPAADAEADPVEPQNDHEEKAVAAEPTRNGRLLQREAWRWAQQNRQADGDLPSGVAIARTFARSPRWGRLVKKAGLTGKLS